MTLILFQRGATAWGFQVGRLFVYIFFPKYWIGSVFKVGWDRSDKEGGC